MSHILSVRLDEEDQQKLTALAKDLAIGPSVLARMLLHASLTTLEQLQVAKRADRLPLTLLSELLAPAAQARRLTEADLQRSVKAARKKLWEERYPDLR